MIRCGQLADYDEWLELWTAYNAFYGRSGDTALRDDLNKLTWQRLLTADEPMILLIAGVASGWLASRISSFIARQSR